MPEHESHKGPESGQSDAAKEAYAHLAEFTPPTEQEIKDQAGAEAQKTAAELAAARLSEHDQSTPADIEARRAGIHKLERMDEMQNWSAAAGKIAETKATQQQEIVAAATAKMDKLESVDGSRYIPGGRGREADKVTEQLHTKLEVNSRSYVEGDDKSKLSHNESGDVVAQPHAGADIDPSAVYRSPANMGESEAEPTPNDEPATEK